MWSDAKAIDTLQKQIDERFPGRSKASDGTIGDANHQNRSSDHNPWVRRRDGSYAVTAVDITHDPAHGVDCNILSQQLLDSRDRRIKFIIWNHKITAGKDGPSPWQRRPYGGTNPHTHHMHLSVEDSEELFDDPREWTFSLTPTQAQAHLPSTPTMPKLRNGMIGPEVTKLQNLLNMHGASLRVDGDFGPATDRAVRMFQRSNGLTADGVVGPYTWEKLEK